MGRRVDVDDLVDAAHVAAMIGLSHRNSIRVYRSRYPDFPQPVIDMGGGRCLLWDRRDVERWLKTRVAR